MTPSWLFQTPEIMRSLIGVFMDLKWLYVGIFRGLKRHLIGWKRWYYGSILKWLTNTEKTVPTQSGSVQVLPQHIFFVGGGLALQQLSKGRLSKETIVQGTFVQGTAVQGDFCPRKTFVQEVKYLYFCPRNFCYRNEEKNLKIAGNKKKIIEIFFNYSWNVGSVLLMDFCTPPPPPGWFGAKLFSIKQDEQRNNRALRNGVLGAQ